MKNGSSSQSGHQTRRQLLAYGGALGGGVAFYNFGFPFGGSEAHAAEAVNLTIWTPGGSAPTCNVQTAIAADFAATSDAAEATLQCGAGGTNDFIQVLLASIAAGNPPDATILWDSPIALGARGALAPLDDLLKSGKFTGLENWPTGLLKTTQYLGRTYGFPVTAGVYGIWYNMDLFEQKGIPTDRESFPKTWDELRKLSKEFTVWEGDRLASAGFIPWRDHNTIPIWSALNGSQIFDGENQKYTIDSAQNIEMMEYAVDWLNEEYRGDIQAVNQSGSWWVFPSKDGQPPAFQKGRLAAVEAGSWIMGSFSSKFEPVFERWNVARHPFGPSGSGSVSGSWPNWVAIPKGSRNPEQAFAYIDYLSGVGVAKWYNAVPDIPTNKLVPLTLPEIVVKERGEEFAKDITEFYKDQIGRVTPMWDSPVQGYAADQLKRALEAIMTKAAAPRDALQQAQRDCQAELDRFLRT